MSKHFLILLFALATGLYAANGQYGNTTNGEPPTENPATDKAGQNNAQPANYDADLSQLPPVDYSKPKEYTINDIKIHGTLSINTDLLISNAGLVRGEKITIPGSGITKAMDRLWNWSNRYFSDIQVYVDFLDGDKVDLEIHLSERPRVTAWRFEGIRKGQATTLNDEMQLKRGVGLSDNMLERNMNHIKNFFIKKGFRNVEVVPKIEDDPIIKNAVSVTFLVKKNERVRIGEINFDGNEVHSDKKLRRQMKKTHRTSLNIFQSAKFDETEYQNDKSNIIDYYNSTGYRNALILKDSVYVINPKRLGISISVEEGEKFYIRNITWMGNTVYNTELLSTLFGFKTGDVYDKKTINKRLGLGKEVNLDDPTQITALYQNEGYLTSLIEPMEIIVAPDSLDLEIKIFEGRQFTINDVNISGNFSVNDEVIRRDLYTNPGELYNRAMIMQTMRMLVYMKHFDEKYIFPEIMPVTNELVDIGWPLVETNSNNQVNIAGGWGGGMFFGQLGFTLRNIDIGSVFKKGAWRPFPQGKNQELSINWTTNGKYYQSFSANFIEPWLGGRKPNSLTVSLYHSVETDAVNYGGFVKSSGASFKSTGVAVGLGKRLTTPDPYFQIYNELSFSTYKLRNWNYSSFIFANGRSNIFAFKTVLSRNSVNSIDFPSTGSEFTVSLAVTPPYSLFSGKNYEELALNNDVSRYRWIEYHKWTGRAQWFMPLTKNNKLVLMMHAEMGYLGYYNRFKQSPFEGFDVGGDGMSGYSIYGVDMIRLRGYKDGTLTPTYGSYNSGYANLYNKYTFELRYPLLNQGGTLIYGLVFAEAGNAFMSWKEFDPFKLKRSAGLGVRVKLPMVGWLGFDWGYGFDNQVGSTTRSGGQIHFLIGTNF